MFLNRLFRLPLIAVLSAFTLPACGQFGVDASSSGRIGQPAAAPKESPPDGSADCPPRPSPRELRQARADVWAEQILAARGGLIRYADDGSASRIGEVRFPAARNALAIGISADPLLNLDGGVPHALDFTVYHLRQPLELNRLFRLENYASGFPDASAAAGPETDEGSALDGGSAPHYRREDLGAYVANVERFSIQPGQNGVVSLSRPADCRYVALVAGYHRRDDSWANVMHVGEYPVGSYEQREKRGHFYRRTTMFRPLPLNLEVELGPEAMRVYAADRLLHPLRDVRVASAYRAR